MSLSLSCALLAACATARPPERAEAVAAAPRLAGAWQGAVVASSLRLVLTLERRADAWTGAVDSVDQHARVPVETVSVGEGTLSLSLPRIDATYVARVRGDTLVGTWTQHGHGHALDFKQRAGAAPLAGAWDGTLEVRLPVVLKIAAAGAAWTATVDSPEQHARDIPVDSVTVAGDAVVFALPKLAASYTARVDGDRLVGTFTQHGHASPLDLTRTSAPLTVARRPQEPTGPLPYVEVPLVVASGPGVALACTLTEPRGAGPFAAVYLATGSGPQDRDETLAGHKPFLVLSDALTRRGIAVLRCDDRGVGASTGVFAAATTLDFAADALAAVAALRARPEISAAHVGVVGHSEGATVAAIAAARSSDVAFVVLLAGPGLPGAEIEDLQRAWAERQAGVSAREIADVKAKWDLAYAIVAAEPDDAAATKRLRALHDGLPAADRAQLAQAGGFDAQVAAMLSPWHRAFLTLDPRAFLVQVRVPVLALDGERDVQVEPDANLPELRKALARDADVTVRELPGLNHLFQTAKTGATFEYADIDETMSATVLTLVADWIARRAP
ncbi:MAG TPA: alpha/beta fold hydrolase [Polyangia bacterium]|nr:alpha/beta fold hydrolase [Polyangia bacterium]